MFVVRLNVWVAHLKGLLKRFSRDMDREGKGNDGGDVPLAVRAKIRKGKAIARNEQEDDNRTKNGKETAMPVLAKASSSSSKVVLARTLRFTSLRSCTGLQNITGCTPRSRTRRASLHPLIRSGSTHLTRRRNCRI